MTNNNDDFSLTWKLYSTWLFRKSLLVSCQKLTRYNHLPLYGVYVNFGSNLQMMFMFMLSWLLLSFCWNFYFFLTIIMIIIGNNNDLGDIYINVLAWLNPTFHCIIIMKKCLLSLNGIHFNVFHSLLWNDHNRELILVFDRCTFYGASCFWTHTISFLIITNLTGQTCLDFVFGPFFHLHYEHLPAQFLFDTFSKLLLIMRMKWLSFSIPQHHHVHFNMVVWTMLKWTCQSCVHIVWTKNTETEFLLGIFDLFNSFFPILIDTYMGC